MKLLVIDDDSAFVYMFCTVFRGYHVDKAPTVLEAKRYLAEYTPDIMVVDLLLPGNSDGLYLTKMLRQDSRFDRTVIKGVTAPSNADSRVRAMAENCDLFYPKPFSLLTLRADLQERGLLEGMAAAT